MTISGYSYRATTPNVLQLVRVRPDRCRPRGRHVDAERLANGELILLDLIVAARRPTDLLPTCDHWLSKATGTNG